MAIGWHFHNEGWEKVGPLWNGEKGFSAEGYLKNSTGPLAPYFRGLIPDVNGLAKLDPVRLKAAWRADVDRITAHYGFDDSQKSKAKQELAQSDDFVDAWFSDREKREKVRQYKHDLYGVQKVERDRQALSFERERAAAKRKELDADRAELTKELDARGSALREAVAKLATDKQTQAAGSSAPPRSQLEMMNLFISYSIWLIGICLMLGLLTRLAALGGAAFLLQIYLSMPPWPGLPASPKSEGHYYFVDKNFVEMLACLSLAFLPTGHWVGLDALFFGKRRHARALRLAERDGHEQAVGAGRGSHRVH